MSDKSFSLHIRSLNPQANASMFVLISWFLSSWSISSRRSQGCDRPTVSHFNKFRLSTCDRTRIWWMAISLRRLRRCGCGTPSLKYVTVAVLETPTSPAGTWTSHWNAPTHPSPPLPQRKASSVSLSLSCSFLWNPVNLVNPVYLKLPSGRFSRLRRGGFYYSPRQYEPLAAQSTHTATILYFDALISFNLTLKYINLQCYIYLSLIASHCACIIPKKSLSLWINQPLK